MPNQRRGVAVLIRDVSDRGANALVGMVVSAQSIWLLVLVCCGLLSARAWTGRRDPRAMLLSGGAAGLACVSLAAIYAAAGW